jgi:hypothetical protein
VGSGQLPFTGGGATGPLVVAGLVLVLVGAALRKVPRRS